MSGHLLKENKRVILKRYASPCSLQHNLQQLIYWKNVSLQWASLLAQMVKDLPALWETWVWSLGWEDPLEEGMATHSNILAWRIPMDRGACSLQSVGSQRVRHDWATKAQHSKDGWVNKEIVRYIDIYMYIYVYTYVCVSGTLLNHKKNEILPFVTCCMDLQVIILSEINHSVKDNVVLDLPYVWNLKDISIKVIDTENRLVVARGRGWSMREKSELFLF